MRNVWLAAARAVSLLADLLFSRDKYAHATDFLFVRACVRANAKQTVILLSKQVAIWKKFCVVAA